MLCYLTSRRTQTEQCAAQKYATCTNVRMFFFGALRFREFAHGNLRETLTTSLYPRYEPAFISQKGVFISADRIQGLSKSDDIFYLSSSFLFCKYRLYLQNKSDWSKHKKPANITVTSRICFFGYPQSKFVFLFFFTQNARGIYIHGK